MEFLHKRLRPTLSSAVAESDSSHHASATSSSTLCYSESSFSIIHSWYSWSWHYFAWLYCTSSCATYFVIACHLFLNPSIVASSFLFDYYHYCFDFSIEKCFAYCFGSVILKTSCGWRLLHCGLWLMDGCRWTINYCSCYVLNLFSYLFN